MVEDPGTQQPVGRTRLVVLYGGRSAEHEVSCISGLHVIGAVDPDRFDLRLIGITTDGRWVDTTTQARALEAGTADSTAGTRRPGALPSPDTVLGDHPDQAADLDALRATDPAQPGPVVVLPLVHGPMGEDGTIQGLLELAGLPYCGPGVAGSAVCMDKGLTKSLLTASGLPQARYLYVSETEAFPRGALDAGLTATVETELGWPVFVKPANMGSSIGISKVKDPGGLEGALASAARYDTGFVIEEAISGRELEIGVLGWPEVATSVPGEVRPSRDFYDFEDKYLDGAAGLEIPAQLPDDVAAEMSRVAVAACRALRVDSMARVDFFFEEDGRGLLINEVNTIPGFTPISMYPRMWAASGIPYRRLIDTLVDQALRRSGRRSRLETGR